MNHIYIDGADLTEEEQAVVYIKEQFDIQTLVGNNLDSLWDDLSIERPAQGCTIHLYNMKDMRKNLGEYAQRIQTLFTELPVWFPEYRLVLSHEDINI